ncbi:MAG: SWIM zinc finger family protein, partial [Verrucomicrobiaceae bacterium]
MLKRILAERDPVVTCGGGMLRFEGFSACCSTYCRVDLDPDAYDGVTVGQGTTNVDFNAPVRAALAQIRDHECVGIAVGTDEVALLRGSDQIIERKVQLPIRWLKGFTEVQAYQAKMERRVVFGRVEAIRFFRSLPRTAMAKTAYWIVPSSGGVRVSQCATREGIRIAGVERLRILEELVPYAEQVIIAADNGEASEWTLCFGPLRFTLAITAEVWRGFSGEGQTLVDLAGGACAQTTDLVRGLLKWQAELRAEEFAANFDLSAEAVRQSISVLGSRGLVGFDRSSAAYFHRELPFDLALVEEFHPRIKSARRIIESGGIRILRRVGGGL